MEILTELTEKQINRLRAICFRCYPDCFPEEVDFYVHLLRRGVIDLSMLAAELKSVARNRFQDELCEPLHPFDFYHESPDLQLFNDFQ